MFFLRVEMRFFGFEKCAVVPFHAQNAVGVDAIQFDHIGGDVFEKIAIVADDDARERRVEKKRFEPDDSGEIEVIGGLVEQKNVRGLHERFGDGEPFAPAAGKRRGFRFEIFETRAAQRFGRARRVFCIRNAPLFGEQLRSRRESLRRERTRKPARRK